MITHSGLANGPPLPGGSNGAPRTRGPHQPVTGDAGAAARRRAGSGPTRYVGDAGTSLIRFPRGYRSDVAHTAMRTELGSVDR